MTSEQLYWNKVANEKQFTHPINSLLLQNLIDKSSFILDYGCGYGRLVEKLNNEGFTNIQGFDFSVELINRGNKLGIENIFQINSATDLPIEDLELDCILLFAVLTCIPSNIKQTELIRILHSKLKENGIIYISDYYLQNNSSEVDQYRYLNDDAQNYGVFALPEGVTFRHHTKDWIKTLLKDFRILNEVKIEVSTMNGNKGEAFQLIAQKI